MRADTTILYSALEYRNLSTPSTSLFLKTSEYIRYEEAAELLAIDNTLGFRVFMTPILNITIFQVESNPLKIGISLRGLSGTIHEASLNATVFHLIQNTPYPSISGPITCNTVSNMTGGAELEFPTINADETLYLVLVKANLGGVIGIGYHTNAHSADSHLLPITTDYQDGKVSLIHQKNVTVSHPYEDAVYYNVTFINQIGNTGFRTVDLGTSHGISTVSEPNNVCLGVGNPGILLISSKTIGDDYSLTIVPWGIIPLGLTTSYGADPMNRKTVVMKSQHVSINGISYQIMIALWRLIVEG
jgi:hypothetical protein